MWGQYCNQTVDPLSCIPAESYFPGGDLSGVKSYNQTKANMVSCKSSSKTSCLGDGEPKVYSLDVLGVAQEFTIMARDIKFNVTAANNSGNVNGINLMSFARHGAIPSASLHDYSSDLSKTPLSILSPKVGRWYISILPVSTLKEPGGTQNNGTKVCYSMESQVLECPFGKAGANCTWERYVLQFMDFWLSFMAVVSTFVYLATIDEVFQRAIHTAVAILTALMAATKATRSSNIVLVIAIGALGLLIGWLIEISTNCRSFSFSIGCSLNVTHSWQNFKGWVQNLIQTLFRRFRWGFLLAGFATLAMAAISWKLETSESYWIWHSVWHVTIYTSSLFFLCSKSSSVNNENQRPPDRNYELTRQDSFSRGVAGLENGT
ncbi:hypothetical protein CJ030_MR4G001674 [Morella rubra]|uniref:Transmembrane protein 8B n=1 Tax=Morella rubra TaxID=262757 RepID=A0A6A1VRR4_9ROSI|nr:hypothetical protein CJ030_MR4G001674 [Morella rubra]